MRVFIQDDARIATRAKVLLEGNDISSRCYGADERRGEAYCYRTGANGMGFLLTDDKTGIAKEVLRGRVKIVVPLRLRVTFWLNKILFYDLGEWVNG